MKKDNCQEPRKAAGRRRSVIPFAFAILVVLGLVFGGWGTVYAAQDSQPDDFLYPVKVAVEYLEDLTQVTEMDDEPSPIGGERNGIQDHDRIQDQDRTHIDDNGVDWEEDGPPMYRWGENAPDVVEMAEPLLDDLTIDDTLKTTQTMSGTQVMSMTQEMSGILSMTQVMSRTQEMSGTLYGPGPCVGGPENCELELTAPYGYTYTHGVDGDAPFKADPPLDGPPATENPGDNDLGFGPGENTTKEVQEPVEVKEPVDNTPVSNSGATDNSGAIDNSSATDTGGQKEGGKP